MKTANSNFRVSIIIPAFNEVNKIGRCLKFLSKQTYKKIEVILVDDCSKDEIGLIASKIGYSLRLNLKIIKLKEHRERGVARNMGAKKAAGDYLLFIDADMEVSKNVVAECVTTTKDNYDVKSIIIPEKSYGEGFWARCRQLEKKCYLGDDRIEAARFFEKRAFWKVDGWDEKMVSGEDWDLTRRIRSKYKVGRINSFIYHNEYKLTLGEAMKRKFYYASVSGIYLEKNPLSILTLIFFIFRPAYLRNWKLILSDPIYGLGMFFLKIMELFAGGAGYLVSKLPNLR